MTKTRFAPSPTGELHIGGARTALFAYLFAKSKGGEFLLRIEDTDRERYVEGSVERIVESMNWLGLLAENIDKPMIQSERLEVYKKHAFDLVRAGKAYICTCSKEKLLADRERQIKEGKPPRYEGHCRTAELKIEDMAESGYVIRMKMPTEGKIVVNDLIRGKVEFEASLIDDQVILKSDGYPTYHLASVIDDSEMGITDVIRAEEWLSSTPKHLVLYEMLGLKAPNFGHLSMILGPDKKKLSKRHGATSVIEYRDQGILPEALVNFIAFLGWNPKDEREVFSLFELEKEFKIENVNRASAVFDMAKLLDLNEKYIRKMAEEDREGLSGLLEKFGLENLGEGEADLISRGGHSTIIEVSEDIKKLRKMPEYEGGMLVFRKSDKERTILGISKTRERLAAIENWNIEEIQQAMATTVQENELSNGDVFWPTRVALSGEEKSPSPEELLSALGKDESLKRIDEAILKLK